MHHSEHPDVVGLDRVQDAVGEAPDQTPPHSTDHDRSGLGELNDLRHAGLNRIDEGAPEPRALSLEVLRCF